MAVSRYPTVDSRPVLDPGPVGLSDEQSCNSIRCPVGLDPGSAFFLLSRRYASLVSKTAMVSFRWNHEGSTSGTAFGGYILHRATVVGLDGDSNAPVLCEFRDKRQVLKLSSINKSYNVRRCSSEHDKYHTDTLNAGAAWTWQGLFGDVWGFLPSTYAGSAPTLPYSPAESPENFRFHAMSAWDAIGQILAAVESELVFNPLSGTNGTFTVVKLSEAQSGLTSALSTLDSAGRRMLDDTPLTDMNLATAPATIRFFFPKKLLNVGKETDSYNAGGLLIDPWYTADHTTSISGAGTGTVLPVRRSEAAEVNSAGTVANSAALIALAAELGAVITSRIGRQQENGIHVYSGIVTSITPGTEVHEIVWRDYGDGNGTVTELHRVMDEPEPAAPAHDHGKCGCGVRLGVLGGALSQGSSATVNEIALNTSNVDEYTGVSFTVWDFLLNAGESVDSGVKVICVWSCDRWYAIPYCDVSDTLP